MKSSVPCTLDSSLFQALQALQAQVETSPGEAGAESCARAMAGGSGEYLRLSIGDLKRDDPPTTSAIPTTFGD